MRAMEIAATWGPENIQPVTRPDPEASHGERVVAMQALSVNPRDSVVVEGGYGRLASLPLVSLCDGAGTIVDVGAGG